MNFRRCMIMFCRNWSVRSIIIGENRRSAASFCARRQSGSAGFIIPTIKSVIRRTLRWKSFCAVSYTHLDVYKRQAGTGTTSNTTGNTASTGTDTSPSGSSTSGSSSTGLTDGGLNPSYTTGVSGSDVVSYASQFLGNPYVLGGTSLTSGTDCSYFVMAVYQHFGISLPR